ncbi:MAG: hypothetical protein WCD56_09590 [Pseudolabrys sp.]
MFSGKTWQQQIYPMVKNVILQNDWRIGYHVTIDVFRRVRYADLK